MRSARVPVAWETPRQQDGGAAGRLAGPVVSLGSRPFCPAKSSRRPGPSPRLCELAVCVARLRRGVGIPFTVSARGGGADGGRSGRGLGAQPPGSHCAQGVAELGPLERQRTCL